MTGEECTLTHLQESDFKPIEMEVCVQLCITSGICLSLKTVKSRVVIFPYHSRSGLKQKCMKIPVKSQEMEKAFHRQKQ